MEEYIVQTKAGAIRGYKRNGIVEYLGIPFAEPPVEKLRFKRSIPKRPWTGVFDAKEYGPESVQFDEGRNKGSEDCLTVNVQRPDSGERDLPVFVWIHGGGYNTGAASVPLYNGISFAREELVFVSFQYRLNVLGFYDFTTYPGCEDFDSNCGLSDQILALKWVHENIAAFGGDPERITIGAELMSVPTERKAFCATSQIPRAFSAHTSPLSAATWCWALCLLQLLQDFWVLQMRR